MKNTVEFSAPCWIYTGKGSWHFVTLPEKAAAEIAYFSNILNGGKRIGWGSVRVTVQIGKTSWETSLFPTSKSKSYLLPLKASVRKAENIFEGHQVKIKLLLPMP
jgi:hypothetical protein